VKTPKLKLIDFPYYSGIIKYKKTYTRKKLLILKMNYHCNTYTIVKIEKNKTKYFISFTNDYKNIKIANGVFTKLVKKMGK